ncbi:MAG: peptidase, partial [Planctomycetota bacterium]
MTLALLLPAAAQAASPRFTNILPHGGQRGTEVDVVLYGSNLQDAEEVLLYDSGMEVVSLTHPEDENQRPSQVLVKFRIAADCPLGAQRMRIRTRTGLSDLQSFRVGALPVVEEAEPNTDFEQPQVIANNSTVHGRVDNEDVDYYVVECKAGERLTAEVFGLRLGYSSSGNFFDPYVAILNEERFELAASDDTALVWNDAVASIIVPEDGKYYVQIRDASYLGDGRAYYLLSIGQFPRPQGVVPAGGKPGETLTVTFLGDVNGEFQRQVTLPTDVPEEFGLDVTDDFGIAPSPMVFRINDLDNVIEQEPNNAADQPTPGPAPAAFNGVLAEPGDVDYFKFTAAQGQVFELEMYARRIRSALDPVLYICNAQGGRISGNDDSRGPDSYIRFQVPADGEYLLEVRDHLNNGGPEYTYRVEVTPVVPKITAATLDVARYVQPDIVVPQGGGQGVIVNVARADVGGPVAFKSDDLPAGVSIECPEGWRGGGQMPVVFYATPDAPVAGRYSNITTYLNDPNQPDLSVEGPLTQTLLKVRGPNNSTVWTEPQTRVAVVVAEKAPFKVWVEPPKVPLVRGGSMNIKVVCERDEGFTAPINLRVLQNPPGCNSSGSVAIAEGQTEALIPFNAAGNAPVQTTMFAVRAFAAHAGGTVESCTPFVPLTVEEQYVTFTFAQAAVEQAKEAPLLVTVTKRKDFEGEAQVTLLGLPANTTAEPLTMTKDSADLTFLVKAAENAPVSDNQNLFCQVLIPEAGETILHNLGTGRLRVDPPPPEPVKPAPMPEPE